MAKKEHKKETFAFSTGYLGRIPSSQNGSEKVSYARFKNEFNIKAQEDIEKKKFIPRDKYVYIFVAQLLKSEREFHGCDIDNMVKSVVDILIGKCYEDDGKVTSLWISKDYQAEYKDDFYFIGIRYLGEDRDPGNLNREGLHEAKQLYKKFF